MPEIIRVRFKTFKFVRSGCVIYRPVQLSGFNNAVIISITLEKNKKKIKKMDYWRKSGRKTEWQRDLETKRQEEWMYVLKNRVICDALRDLRERRVARPDESGFRFAHVFWHLTSDLCFLISNSPLLSVSQSLSLLVSQSFSPLTSDIWSLSLSFSQSLCPFSRFERFTALADIPKFLACWWS